MSASVRCSALVCVGALYSESNGGAPVGVNEEEEEDDDDDELEFDESEITEGFCA